MKNAEDENLEMDDGGKMAVISLCDTLYGKTHDGRRFGFWECGDGWIHPLTKLSYRLEYMNRTEGRRFGLRIHADQVKEKFGTLRFYYSVLVVYPWWTKILSFPFDFISGLIEKNVDFKYRYEGWTKIPTRNLFLHSLKTALLKAGRFLDLSFLFDASRGKDFDVAMENFNVVADDLVDSAERECFGTCEVCGTRIGGEHEGFEPRCETKGWIRYVCRRCAEKNGWSYEVVS